MTEQSAIVTLTAADVSLVLSCAIGAKPAILYWGPKLAHTDPALIAPMTGRQHAPGGPDQEIKPSLLNEVGLGINAASSFSAHRNGTDWASVFQIKEVRHPTGQQAEIVCEDDATQVRAIIMIQLDPDSGLVTYQTEIENLGDSTLSIEACAAACVPLDPRVIRWFGFAGRWAGEFQLEEIAPFQGSYVRENKAGRTSHDNFPGFIAGLPDSNEQAGLCFAFHLGWSGNSRLRVDRLSDGRSFLQMGELFFPGELSLAPAETYRTPHLYTGVSACGYSDLSRRFHRHLRQSVMEGRTGRMARPVHYNTWEAVYFDHDPERLFALADKAAEIGAERFILDDGWFGSRRDDKAGLGDWWPSEDIYSDGLGPLIDHVTGLGMEFGLWFEPEMVNPDSDLYRAHPDWVLQADGLTQISSRHQYVLDLTRAEVGDYLFERMHSLLQTHPISYIKWDMNRDIHHPGSQGRAVAGRQTRAVYALIDRLRAAHPELEIESCSSGGGRADYGILARTDRIWTSDNNDALDRQRIQRGASHFFPLDVTGAHVGPAKCHITGRRLNMRLRVASALFGHMGLELDLLDEDLADLDVLKAGIALHKQHRALIHTGDFHRLDTPDHVNAVGVIAADRTQALFSWCNLTGHRETLPGRLYVPGLDAGKSYRTRLVWPQPVRSISQPSVLESLSLGSDGAVLPGEALAQVGLQVPLLHPETCLIYHFEMV